jgi:cyclophilin family peptidyl-prolyl cis-trans isomerase
MLPSDYLGVYVNSQNLKSNIQLGIETARWLQEYGRQDQLYDQVLSALLNHENPHVQAEAILAAAQQSESSEAIEQEITRLLEGPESVNAMVWLTALQEYMGQPEMLPENWLQQAEEVTGENSYLTGQWLRILHEAQGLEAYLEQLKSYVDAQQTIRMVQGFTHLGELLSRDTEWTDDHILRTRELTLTAVEQADRGVLYALQPLLMDDRFVLFSDVQRLLEAMEQLRLPEDIEAYQALTRVLYERPAFRKAAQPTIDSLAAAGYEPLNRSLRSMGWDIAVEEEPMSTVPNFRSVDWNRLEKLGAHPVLVLNTEQGNIEVRLNALAAPATVSAMDALMQNQEYDGVPFHRVVCNFVIQGGDVERQDGFGGPDFVIPTEPDVQSFTRGAIGIASAGPDTEGSQYFIMHQWKPHLDGRYTRFGEVIDGMEVVDRIQMGDVVKSVRWK